MGGEGGVKEVIGSLLAGDDLQAPFKNTITLKTKRRANFFMVHKDVFIKNKLTNIFNKYTIEEVVDALSQPAFAK